MRPCASPRAPPAQRANLSTDSRPEINGSYGAFLAVIAVLAAVFVLATLGIFLLLRHHEPTPYERHARKVRARARDVFTAEAPVGPLGMRERVARLFGRRGGGGPGWIKASGDDGDEWDPTFHGAHHLRAGSNATTDTRLRGEGSRYSASVVSGAPMQHADSTDSVEVELHAPADDRSPSAPPSSVGHERTGSRPVSDRADSMDSRRSQLWGERGGGRDSYPFGESPAHSRDPTAGSPPELADSPVEGHHEEEFRPRDDRHFSVQSAGSVSVRSMRKFDNGTKFREGLSF
ncbi:uncharacterized protein BXZ73DRAFT_52976 [Epithele typhae]|uniref:uncharacterized protein n=1 Tax=Epithele typhae TaxID=378194 RepID=UPI00200722A9|nr:uncharacterized protein BXZ73DRAFT_52976 [Epithele typhae]KAH9918341.1 hypothetical protein BXZ73DRAFT_52976 [Epithele typhae]